MSKKKNVGSSTQKEGGKGGKIRLTRKGFSLGSGTQQQRMIVKERLKTKKGKKPGRISEGAYDINTERGTHQGISKGKLAPARIPISCTPCTKTFTRRDWEKGGITAPSPAKGGTGTRGGEKRDWGET